MTSIANAQRQQLQIDRLAAQRRSYSDAKRLLAVHIILTVPVTITVSLISSIYPDCRVLAAAWAFVLLVAEFVWLTPTRIRIQETSAKIQELFDCDVLQLEWPYMIAGSPPDGEVIHQLAKRAELAQQTGGLVDWYSPVVDAVPVSVGRVICQRTNCFWDADLRKKFTNCIVVVLLSFFLLTMCVSLVSGFTLEKLLLTVLYPALPALKIGWQWINDNKRAARFVDQTKGHIDHLWTQIIQGTVSESDMATTCRRIQDLIYDKRCRSPLIFDWLYYRNRKPLQGQADYAAERLVEQYGASVARVNAPV